MNAEDDATREVDEWGGLLSTLGLLSTFGDLSRTRGHIFVFHRVHLLRLEQKPLSVSTAILGLLPTARPICLISLVLLRALDEQRNTGTEARTTSSSEPYRASRRKLRLTSRSLWTPLERSTTCTWRKLPRFGSRLETTSV